MKVIVLAAGYATRLYPLTKDKPKALLPVGSRPLLDHLYLKVQELEGADEFLVVTNDRFYGHFSRWANPTAGTPAIRVLNDGTTTNDNRLGAIGDLDFAVKSRGLEDDLLVLASDNLFDSSLSEFVSFARSRNAVVAGVFDIGDKSIAAGRYGIFELDKDSRVLGFEEKPEEPKTAYVSIGIYYFPRSTLAYLDEYLAQTKRGDAPGYYISWLLKKTGIYAFFLKGRWYDIGSLEQLEEASRAFAS